MGWAALISHIAVLVKLLLDKKARRREACTPKVQPLPWPFFQALNPTPQGCIISRSDGAECMQLTISTIEKKECDARTRAGDLAERETTS
jgi:hypothetical protein